MLYIPAEYDNVDYPTWDQLDAIADIWYARFDLRDIADDIDHGNVPAYMICSDSFQPVLSATPDKNGMYRVLTADGDNSPVWDQIYVYVPLWISWSRYNPEAGKACARALREVLIAACVLEAAFNSDLWDTIMYGVDSD